MLIPIFFYSSTCSLRKYTDGATIESISDNVVVNPGDEAKLACVVKGNITLL